MSVDGKRPRRPKMKSKDDVPEGPPSRETGISRRQALAWLSCLPWAAGSLPWAVGFLPWAVGFSGCDSASRLESSGAGPGTFDLGNIEGHIVGPSMAAGHRLRTGDFPSVPVREGIEATHKAFMQLVAEGRMDASAIS